MNLLTFSIETFQALTKYDESVNTESVEAQIKYADIWDECHMKLKERYNLPLLRLTGEGFEMGSASVTDCIYIARIIRERHKKEVYFYHKSELTLFDFLNQELIELMRPEVNKLITFYNLYCSQYLKLKTA